MSFDQAKVTAFYESHPYPYRPPGQVSDAKLIGIPGDIRFINHYVFGGRRDFKRPMRVLVAGGGTGDAVIGLGRQLAELSCPTEMVYIDLSKTSREIAEERARQLGLTGVQFLSGRIQDLPKLAPGPYDYIDFCGVINHVGNQQEILCFLSELLTLDGGIGVMAYGKLGRSGVYHVQDMLRLVDTEQSDVATARALLSALPETNWHKRNNIFADTKREPDVEIADRYLNPSDRAFTVADLRHLAAAAGFRITAFVPPLLYDVASTIQDDSLRRRILKLDWIDRCIFAELFNGDVAMHNFYLVGKSKRVNPEALLKNKATIPTMASIAGGSAPIVKNGVFGFTMRCGPVTRTLALPGTEHTAPILRAVNGKRTLQQIHRTLPGNLSWRAFEREFAIVYRGLNGAGEMVLSTTAMPN